MSLEGLSDRIGHRFDDLAILERALRHRSWCAEHEDVPSNERLEFLGDAVLGWAVADLAFRKFPDEPEGVLTAMRINVVHEAALADIAREIDLGSDILLGNGEQQAGGADKPSILSDAFEAVLGAVYLDGGADAVFGVVGRLVSDRLTHATESVAQHDRKTELQELCARLGRGAPVYELRSTGPDHAKVFTAEVRVDAELLGTGTGSNKKSAEQDAAGAACLKLA